MAHVPILGGRKRTATASFPEVAVAEISDQALTNLVSNVTLNVTKNVVNNLMARLKDRCVFIGHRGRCNVTRVAHTARSHDFVEPTTVLAPPALNAKETTREEFVAGKPHLAAQLGDVEPTD